MFLSALPITEYKGEKIGKTCDLKGFEEIRECSLFMGTGGGGAGKWGNGTLGTFCTPLNDEG